MNEKAIAEKDEPIFRICSHCQRILSPSGSWITIGKNVIESGDLRFSHSLCPDCALVLYYESLEELDLDDDPQT